MTQKAIPWILLGIVAALAVAVFLVLSLASEGVLRARVTPPEIVTPDQSFIE